MKKAFIGIGVFLMVITLSACNKKQEDTNASIEEKKGGSVSDMMQMKESQKCVLKEGGKEMSVVYIDGDRVRTDGDVAVMGGENMDGTASMISDGEWVYTWNSAEKKGIKMKNMEDDAMEEVMEEVMEDEVDEGDYDETSVQEMIDEFGDKNLDYSCGKWKVDEKVFVPPTDVEFVDMNAMMEDIGGAMGEGVPTLDDVTIPQM